MSSSQSHKIEVLWSPNKEEDFATYSTELRFYTIQNLHREASDEAICMIVRA